MNFNQLIYCYEIFKTNSFNKASANLNLSQSTLSKQIKSLEQEIGFKVFDRSNTGTQITKKGKDFIDEIMPIVEEFIKIRSKYTRCDTLIVNSNAPGRAFDAYVKYIQKDNAEVEIKSAYECIDNIKNNLVDLSIISVPENQLNKLKIHTDSKKLNYTIIGRDKISCVIGLNSSMYNESEINTNQLKDKLFVKYKKLYECDEIIKPGLNKLGLYEHENIKYVDSIDTLTRILNSIDSFSLIGSESAEVFSTKGLKSLSIKNCEVNILYLAITMDEIHSKEVEQFIKLFNETNYISNMK